MEFSQYLDFFAPSDSRFSNSCISAKYCPILTNHTSTESLFIQINLKKKLTLMTGFVVQGHNSDLSCTWPMVGKSMLDQQKQIF